MAINKLHVAVGSLSASPTSRSRPATRDSPGYDLIFNEERRRYLEKGKIQGRLRSAHLPEGLLSPVDEFRETLEFPTCIRSSGFVAAKRDRTLDFFSNSMLYVRGMKRTMRQTRDAREVQIHMEITCNTRAKEDCD